MAKPDMLPVAEALKLVLEGAERLGSETVPLSEARGRTLASPVIAARTQPPFPASAMDGYAVRAEDARNGASLTMIGESSAGHLFSGGLDAGQAVRIFTGAAVPEGADSVLIQEDTERNGDSVLVREDVRLGQHIRPAGLDFRAGDVLLEAGDRLSDRAIGLAAATGCATLEVARRPRVAILATGDELIEPGLVPGPGQISGSNGIMLESMVRDAGGEPLYLGIAPDDIDSIRDGARRAREQHADIIVTTGGASVGERDLVQEALGLEGLKLDFWRIALRPGRPLMAGRIGAMRMLGLPGNPVSTHVCAFLFLVPLLRALQGAKIVHHSLEGAILGSTLAANELRQDYLRGKLHVRENGLPIATPFGRQDSSMLRLLADADCLIMREAKDQPKIEGDPCRIIRLGTNW